MIFAQCLISHMHENKKIPAEQMAVSGKTSIDRVLMKHLFYDRANVLHLPASLSSTDAANCYDGDNLPMGSLALQAFGISLAFIQTYLSSLQTMQFHLQTGFGLSKESFGSSESPFMGLTQGSGTSPPVWTAISTLLIRSYLWQGYNPRFQSMWTNVIFILAGILFMDNTDLIHFCTKPNMTEEEFVPLFNEQHAY